MPAFLLLLFASVWAVATVAIATGTAIADGEPHSGIFWAVVAFLAMIAVVLVRAMGGVSRRVRDLLRCSPPKG